MFNPSRDEARAFFYTAWAKHGKGEPLTALESQVRDVIMQHPEYHGLLAQQAVGQALEFTPESGQMNPFLHLSLHLAVTEQLSIDQPPGIRAAYLALLHRTGSDHDALHHVIDCLGEIMWRAQQQGTGPDGEAYLECLRRQGGPGTSRQRGGPRAE